MTGVEMLTAPNISPEQSLPAVQILTDVARAAEVRQQMSAQVEVAARGINEQMQQQLDEVMDELNVIARSCRKKLRFQIFEETGELFAQVIDAETGDVIKSVPPLEMLETLARISDAVGLLVDESG